MVVLNHLFRDAVLNALTAIRGHLQLLGEDADRETRARAVEVIDGQTASLEDSVEDVRHLARGKTDPTHGLEPIALDDELEACLASAREEFPAARIDVDGELPAVSVRADALLGRVFELLVENAVVHSDAATPEVTITAGREGGTVRVSIADNGPGLPRAQQGMLAAGTVEEFDDPSTGFGLNVATLLAESYRGHLDATVTEAGTTLDVVLPIAAAETARPGAPSAHGTADVGRTTGGSGVAKDSLALASGAAVVAGVVMGLLLGAMGGSVPVIGALYGVADPVVGWLTHEFHSVVFGVLYLVVLAVAPRAWRESHVGRIGLGACWGAALWLFAAGMVMPLWLQLVGIPASLPTLTLPSLLGHLVWGASLGGLYSLAVRTDVATRLREASVAATSG
jgi:uncharacterized membrane protein YagU involved in acid resistance